VGPRGRDSFVFGSGIEPFVNGAGPLRASQTIEIVTAGGGSYSSPASRRCAADARDLADGAIDVATARAIYGYRRSTNP
jgi:hypothetical protein